MEDLFLIRVVFERYVRRGIHGARAQVIVSCDRPGTYFAAVRCQINRAGDPEDIYCQVLNLDLVRIVAG